MKSALLVMLLAAVATAAVVSNEVPDVDEVPSVVEVPDVDEVADLEEVSDLDEVANENVDKFPEVFVTDEDESMDAAELTDEDEDPAANAVATRRNLNRGLIGSKDVRVLNRQYKSNCIPGRILVRNITVRANRRITAIRVNRVGASQNATPSIIGGGIGKYSVTIRIRSARGRGYHYRVQVYVR